MKIIYSQLKKWLPDLTTNPKQLRDDLTMLGHFASGYEEINHETVLDLEIRQNRADCLGYYGIARELSVFYNIPIVLPESRIQNLDSKSKLPITISSPDVHRLQATKLSNIKNNPSPEWLKRFLALHDINSINTLVDLTNYVMLWWGIPCHAFDTSKVSSLTWENNKSYSEFISLDGTNIKLLPQNLLITDNSKVVSLSFIGGQNSGIELNTNETIIEMAIYNRSRVRNDSRSLKTITEASIRLDKELDTETIPLGFSHLVSLIQENCKGEVSSELFEIYNKKPEPISIPFDPTKPSIFAGVDISSEFALDVLKRLGCTGTPLSPPSIRKDLSIEEDLIEEVIRFYGYNKISTSSPINNTILADITPPILYLIEKTKDHLINLGYDEVRSWPLVQKPLNKNSIYTQNSINSEYPVLRQSMIQSLQNQLDQYSRYKLPNPKFFEIGKIFYQEIGMYIEIYSLGTYDGREFKETILDDIEKPGSYLPSSQHNTAIELTSQIITLDANVTYNSKQDPVSLINHYSQTIDPQYLWQIVVTDEYHDQTKNQYRYTFRVSYYNCDDKTAKELHLKSFNLETFITPVRET